MKGYQQILLSLKYVFPRKLQDEVLKLEVKYKKVIKDATQVFGMYYVRSNSVEQFGPLHIDTKYSISKAFEITMNEIKALVEEVDEEHEKICELIRYWRFYDELEYLEQVARDLRDTFFLLREHFFDVWKQ